MGNAAVESILRHPLKRSEDIPGNGAHTGYHPDGTAYQPDEWPLARSLGQGETVVREPVRFIHADGARTEVELSSAPVRDTEGRTVAGVVVATDITAHHQLQEALRREADVRDKLMGIVSHDLRSPLQAIAASGELLLRAEPLTPMQQKRVARIQTSVQRMDHLIRDLLDFVRVRQEGTLPIERGQASLQETCRAVLDEVQAAHPGRQLLFETHGDTRGEWDASRLAQFVGNLVNNALKHGAEDAPVQVQVVGAGADVVLEVANQGNPIPPELLPRIFEPFTRASTGSDALKGVGLGLFIVHEIVTAHGGHIEVRSTAETGTLFRVRLPRSPGTSGVGWYGRGDEVALLDAGGRREHDEPGAENGHRPRQRPLGEQADERVEHHDAQRAHHRHEGEHRGPLLGRDVVVDIGAEEGDARQAEGEAHDDPHDDQR
jgi:signal transduction histidine kinase